MIKTPWTPGPWAVVPADGHHGGYIEDQNSKTICDLYYMSGMKVVHHQIDHIEANARLIAAAPDLVVMLEKIEQQLDYGQSDAALKLARAALQYVGHPDYQEKSDD